MRSGIIGVMVLAALAWSSVPLAAQFGGSPSDQEAARHGWIFDLEEGSAQARMSGKPLMVVLRCVP